MSKKRESVRANRVYQSRYAGQITFAQTRLPACDTVGELREVLEKLPDDMPLENCDGIKPVWFNIGRDEPGCRESLGLQENDGTWDD